MMDTAQELLQQPIVLAIIAGLFILTAIILFLVPSIGFLFERLKSVVTSESKPQKKAPPNEASKAKTASSLSYDSKKIGYAVVVIALVAVVGLGGLYVYTNFFGGDPSELVGDAKPNQNLRYFLVGEVKKVNHDTGELSIQDKNTRKTITLKINTLTKIFVNGEQVLSKELEEGLEVVVRSNANFAEEEEVNIFEIDILKPNILPDVQQGEETKEIKEMIP